LPAERFVVAEPYEGGVLISPALVLPIEVGRPGHGSMTSGVPKTSMTWGQVDGTILDCREVVGAGQQQGHFAWANIGAFRICLWTFKMTAAQAWGREEDELVYRRGDFGKFTGLPPLSRLEAFYHSG